MRLLNVAGLIGMIGVASWAAVAPYSYVPENRQTGSAAVGFQSADPKPPTWETVAPIMERSCTSCHGQTKAGGIDLRTYESTMASKTVVKGRPAESSLVKSVKPWKGKKPTMPPGRPPLSPKLVKQVEDWVKAGAVR